jgi:acyl carrier protein
MNLNALYGIEIEATDLQQMRTVADVAQVLQRLTREDQQPAA